MFINTGFGNLVNADKVIAVLSPESAPIKRLIQKAKEDHILIDATYGRKTRGIIVTESKHVVLIPLQPETIKNRMIGKEIE